jgi:hypothetical protein
MGTRPAAGTVRVEIDTAEPIGGWIGESGPGRVRFDGWLQLISLLERAAAEVGTAAGRPTRPDAGGAQSGKVPPPSP